MIDIPEPSLPAEVSAVGTPLTTGPSSSQACQGAAAWLAALSPPLAGEQVNASLQVLAKVRPALTQGAVLLPRHLLSCDFKASGKQRLVPAQCWQCW